MARLWARTTTFESVNIGDELPLLVKWETAETIEQFGALAGSVRNGEEEAPDEAGPSASAQAATQALVSYVTELLEKGFPLPAIAARGSSLTLRLIEGVKSEDTICLSGRVVGKDQPSGLNTVECLIRIENQDNRPVAEATAFIAL